jgi:malate dehydrogenase (oxaloacetate-decarboxylating)(NADP+)
VSAAIRSRVVFAEGEEEQVIRAAVSYVNQRLGTASCSAARTRSRNREEAGIDHRPPRHRLVNARVSRSGNEDYTEFLYAPLQRKGYLHRDCQRLINNDRNHFGAMHGCARRCRRHGDRHHPELLDRASDTVRRCRRRQAGPPGDRRFAVLAAGAPCSSPTRPSSTCRIRKNWPTSPRKPPAWPASSATSRASPCSPIPPSVIRRRTLRAGSEAVKILDKRRVDFEYDGEMAADVALNMDKMMAQYPFCRLSGRPTFWSCRHSTRPRSRPRCCRNSAAQP